MTRDQEFYSALSALDLKAYVPGANPRLYDKDPSPLKNRRISPSTGMSSSVSTKLVRGV